MVGYVIPSGVRIADADRVRLGARCSWDRRHARGVHQLQRGNTRHVHGGGRISAEVVVDDGSDIGGASIWELCPVVAPVIGIGRGCLVGANTA